MSFSHTELIPKDIISSKFLFANVAVFPSFPSTRYKPLLHFLRIVTTVPAYRFPYEVIRKSPLPFTKHKLLILRSAILKPHFFRGANLYITSSCLKNAPLTLIHT